MLLDEAKKLKISSESRSLLKQQQSYYDKYIRKPQPLTARVKGAGPLQKTKLGFTSLDEL